MIKEVCSGRGFGYTFDLKALLRYNDLDIRLMATHNLQLSAEEYFRRLSKFTDNASKIAEVLSEIAALDAGESSFQFLLETKPLFDEIGCKRFVSEIYEITDAGKINDKRTASIKAKSILADFNKFCARTLAAKMPGKAEAPGILNGSGADDKSADSVYYGNHSLKKIIGMLDNAEAARKLRILAVDDAPVMLNTITSVLNDQYKVYTLANPKMLRTFLNQITPELFLLDYQMPEINGFELIPIIRSFEEHKNTPVIFLTAMGTMEHISAAMSLGACDFIVKPFQRDILLTKIAKYIVRKPLY